MMLLTRTPSEAPPPVWSRARRFRAPKSIACSVTPSELIGVRGTPRKRPRFRERLGPSRYACSPSRTPIKEPSPYLPIGSKDSAR